MTTSEDTINNTNWNYEELRVIIHPSWNGFSFFKSERDKYDKIGKSFEQLPITLSMRKENDKYYIKCEHSFCIGPNKLPEWNKELNKQDLMLIDQFLLMLIDCPFDMTLPTFDSNEEIFWYKESTWSINAEYIKDQSTLKCKKLSFYPIFLQIFENEINNLINNREEFRLDFNKKFYRKWYYNPTFMLNPADGLTVIFNSNANEIDSASLTLSSEHRIIFSSSPYSKNSCDFILFYDSYNFGYFPYFGLLDYSLYHEIFGKSNDKYAYFEVLSLTTDEMILKITYK